MIRTALRVMRRHSLFGSEDSLIRTVARREWLFRD